MTRFLRFGPISLLALAVLFWTSGCKSNQDQNAANNGQPAAQDSSADPASANLAPVSTAPAAASAGSQPPPTDSNAYDGQGPSDNSDDSYYGEQPVDTASEPPPPLPEYEQPPSPGDDYLWTPGYWGYVSTGYYWIPGAWVQAPYQGALWTPGYWGWSHNRYGFYRGYWGPHIGYYGGVNYGFGYVGVGYQGGYWNNNHFFYNQAVNNINVTVVHNVYNRTVIVNNNARVSYNGGPGGIQVRPRPAELAALREPHAPPMAAQVQNAHAASVDRAQFVAVNHGRPANVVIAKPLIADRDVHPVAAPVARYQPVPEQRGGGEARPNAAPPARGSEPVRPEPVRPEARPNTAPPAHTTPAARSNEPVRPAVRPAPARPETAAPHAAPYQQPQVSRNLRRRPRPGSQLQKSQRRKRKLRKSPSLKPSTRSAGLHGLRFVQAILPAARGWRPGCGPNARGAFRRWLPA
jgi:hypothetical protein